MKEWQLGDSDLKRYPHFDPLIPAVTAQAYAKNKSRVVRHTFYPFIRFEQRWTRFAKKGAKGKPKLRPLRFAARLDAYIFSYYRHVLSQLYEAELLRLGLGECVLAYRRIPAQNSTRGKCNIHFAQDAILKIVDVGDCCAIALDISSYFESLDHARLKELWCRLLGTKKLPVDHFQVYKAITEYSEVSKLDVYERLGHFGEKLSKRTGKTTKAYLTPHNKIPQHLCTGREFRQKVLALKDGKSIVKRNHKPWGVPQGAPISDLLANLYLIDFDDRVAGWVREAGGAYFRYSDDILLIVPGGEAIGKELMLRTLEEIRNFGSKLSIKKEKSSLHVFRKATDRQIFQFVEGMHGKNGFEYLGFRYDGKKVYFRNTAISNLRRKVAFAARREANSYARRYPDKNISTLKSLFNYERFMKRFGKVEDFGEHHADYRSWTFWTYARRASEIFDVLGKPTILRQLRNHRSLTRQRIDKELERAVTLRDERKKRTA